MSEDQNNTSNDEQAVWKFLRLAAMVFAVISVGIFVNNRISSVDSAALTENESVETEQSIFAETPNAASFVEFDSSLPPLITNEDFAFVPASIDDGFREVIRELLAENQVNASNCITRYSLLRYSNVNAQLTKESVDVTTKDFGGSCGGSAVATYSNLVGGWSETPFIGQSPIACSEVEISGLFAEFSGSCFVEDALVPNPNGSILDV